MPAKPVLAVVIPVYNEAQRLRDLLADWQPVFRATGVPYRLIFIDDGSKDASLAMLRDLATNDDTLDVHTQPNAGHGPAILKGYALASEAEWIFQIDSDHQLGTAAFKELWARRAGYDLLMGQRRGPNASAGRQWVTAVSRTVIRTLYGKGVSDVNVPYRLMRTEVLRPALTRIPANSFAPNVLLTSWFIRQKRRILLVPVEQRPAGARKSRLNAYFLKGAVRSFIQTILFRWR
ncbi:MAG TPA: glycosyltransferase family 2 protein [Puia sp.]|nr:glycosyltransferase family 2 protein [Puia sp.]